MSLTNPDNVITEHRLADFYQAIYPYLGRGMSENYSTTEQQIGTWIDGKPIYRIVLTNLRFGGTKNQWVTIQPAITISNLGKFLGARAIRLSDCAIIDMSFKYTSNGLQYYSPVDFTDEDTLILEYTKST